MKLLSKHLINFLLGGLVVVAFFYITLTNPGGVVFFQPWDIFHNYLGAKYLDELGPFDFYACAYEADQEGRRIWTPETPMRDLHTYQLVPAATLTCPKDNFSVARWQSFTHDVYMLTGRASSEYWAQVVTDKGYNATPFRSVVFGSVANMFPLEDQSLLFNLADVLFVLLTAIIVASTEGLTVALLTLLLLLLYFGTFGRLSGNYFQFAWLPLLALAVGAWRKGKASIAGGALGLAAGIHVFPLFFALPIGVRGVMAFLQKEKQQWKAVRDFLSVFVLMGLLCFGVGSLSTRGVHAWTEWEQKIVVHSAYLHGEIFNLGLPTLIATATSVDRSAGTTFVEDFPRTEARLRTFSAERPLWYAGALVVLVVMVGVSVLIPFESLFLLGFLPLFALVSLSPYYYLDLALVPYMAVGLGKKARLHLILLLLLSFFIGLLYRQELDISFGYLENLITQLCLGAYLVYMVYVVLRDRITTKL